MKGRGVCGDPTVFTYPLSPVPPRRANRRAKLNEHSLIKSVCVFVFLWGINNGVSIMVRTQTFYAWLMSVVEILQVPFICTSSD